MRIVIIGAGQAGAAVASKLRQLGHRGLITLVGDESAPPYQRPPLSKAYLLGEIPEERLWLRSPDFWRQQSIDLRLGGSATSIDRDRKVVAVGGEYIPYDQVVLATGSSPRTLPASIGGDLPGVYTLRSLASACLLRKGLATCKRVVVVGGGYVGLEIAAVARKLSLRVTLVEASERILNRVSAPPTSDFLRGVHLENGVTLIEAMCVDRILGEAHVSAVQLSNGSRLPADAVIVGIGVNPNTSLAKNAGLRVDNGIAVDEFGLTSDPSIWAAGDCCSFPWRNGRIRLESVGHAIDQAEAVAVNIIGARKPYQARPWFWSDQYNLKVQIAGLSTGYDKVVTRTHGGTSFWYYSGQDLLAVDSVSDTRAYMIGKRLIEAGISPKPETLSDIHDLRQLLTADLN